jgi:hypothetical protein
LLLSVAATLRTWDGSNKNIPVVTWEPQLGGPIAIFGWAQPIMSARLQVHFPNEEHHLKQVSISHVFVDAQTLV